MPSPKSTRYAYESSTVDLTADAKGSVRVKGSLPDEYRYSPTGRVLLLDDNDDFREIICDYLTSRTYEVTALPNGAAGLRAVMERTFDLIICDMMMPELGGEMFYWAVSRIRQAAGQRFLFITGHQNEPRIQAFFRRVNATVLIKPFKLGCLDAAVSDVLKKLR